MLLGYYMLRIQRDNHKMSAVYANPMSMMVLYTQRMYIAEVKLHTKQLRVLDQD